MEAHQAASESPVGKEIIVGDTRMTAMFPPLELGKEAIITLMITSRKTNNPVRSSKVAFHSSFPHKAGMQDGLTVPGVVGGTDKRVKEDYSIHCEEELEDSADQGMYYVAFLPPQRGEYQIMFHISELDGRKLDPEIVIEAQRTVEGSPRHHSQGSTLDEEDYLLMGGALMGAMMIVVWVARGSIF